MKEKVNYRTELEFIIETADDCISHLKNKDRNYLIRYPYEPDYHFSYGLYIRNHYIHNKDFSEVSFWVEPDDLSSEIIRMIFSKLLPEYEYDNLFIESLYDDRRFIKLRWEYKKIYGVYPVEIVEKYKQAIALEPEFLISENRDVEDEDLDKEFEIAESNHERCTEVCEELIRELAESVWRIDLVKETAEKCGIDFNDITFRIEEIKNIFLEDEDYIPVEVCFLPYKKEIGHNRYVDYRRSLSRQLEECPQLVKRLDAAYFKDRILAKAALKCGWNLKYLTMYQNDDAMVKYCILHNGESIQYAAKRFQTDREWVKLAIEHSAEEAIMSLDCMKQYCKDRELVYLACSINRWNFVYVDKSYRDDFELAKICMEQSGDLNSIYAYLSLRLKENKELAMLDLQEEFPQVRCYSAKLRNDDEIGAELYKLHGADSVEWHHMSKRLKKKYGISKE